KRRMDLGSRPAYSTYEKNGRRFADGILSDISKRKQAEEQARENAAELRSIFESVHAGIVIVDPRTHRITDANPAAQSMIGVASRECLIGAECHRFFRPAEKERSPITDFAEPVDNSEHVLLTASGNSRAIAKTVVPVVIQGREQLLESFIDISELKRTESALRASEARFRSLVENSVDVVTLLSSEGIYLYPGPSTPAVVG